MSVADKGKLNMGGCTEDSNSMDQGAGTLSSNSTDSNTGSSIKDAKRLDQSILMISSRRPRAFYERAARELLASGHQTIELSALGDAIPLAIQLSSTLLEKEAVTLSRVATKTMEFPSQAQDSTDGRYGDRKNRQSIRRRIPYFSNAPGITINLDRHPKFKGTRIVPGYVFFTPDTVNPIYHVFPSSPDRIFGSLNYIFNQNIAFDNTPTGNAFSYIFNDDARTHDEYVKLHQSILDESLNRNKNIHDMKEINIVAKFLNIKDYHYKLKAAFCRICPELVDWPYQKNLGTVFLDFFDDTAYPHDKDNNSCVIHVISPKGEYFKQVSDFLNAITLTAVNLMTSLCDFNGFVKRQNDEPKLRRLGIVRICLFSGEGDYLHPDATEDDVARAIMKGLNIGYHFGPAPRLQFNHPAFKRIWLQETPAKEEALQITDSTFRKNWENGNGKERNPRNRGN